MVISTKRWACQGANHSQRSRMTYCSAICSCILESGGDSPRFTHLTPEVKTQTVRLKDRVNKVRLIGDLIIIALNSYQLIILHIVLFLRDKSRGSDAIIRNAQAAHPISAASFKHGVVICRAHCLQLSRRCLCIDACDRNFPPIVSDLFLSHIEALNISRAANMANVATTLKIFLVTPFTDPVTLVTLVMFGYRL